MPRPSSLLLMLLSALVAPSLAAAATPAQQDYQDARARTPDLLRGAQLYRTCAGCHRADGHGNRDGSVPVIAGQHVAVTLRQLADYRHARRWDPRMQHYADTHVLADAQAMADVAGYIAALERGSATGTGRGDQAAGGRALFTARCAACHGERGRGNADEVVPRIDHQHFAFLARVFRDARAGTRPSFPADHLRLLEGLDEAQLAGLADALSRGL